jgi:feruloyl-CoA synthase
MNTPKYREMQFGVTRVVLERAANEVIYLQAEKKLGAYEDRLSDRFLQWVKLRPEQTWMAQRQRNADGTTGDWRHISYAQAHHTARNIGQALLDLGLNQDRPVAILSDNDVENALIALACLYVGVPYCPVSPAYSVVSQDFEKLRHVLTTITPGLVFAADSSRYGKAIAATVAAGTKVVITRSSEAIPDALSFDALANTVATAAVDEAQQRVGPDSIAKFLFTSGSTKLPKGVINTQGMLCANQKQMELSMPVMGETPPVLVDWLPWNHTFGGNHNFGLILYYGGTLYIDEGKPTPALVGETLRNLREIAPTLYFNVPTGFEAIANEMKTDLALRKQLLSRVRMFFYAGAALGQPVWDSLHASQEAQIGERIVMGTGLGMTESSPFGLFITNPNVKAGYLGVPTPGLELKLVPTDGKVEVRYRGPNITPGYWRNPEATAESFDEEGFFKTGDAVLWIDDNDPHQGLRFDGRIAEDFKLSTGTFVSVGPMRSKIIAAGAPYVQDAVITGLNLSEVGAMIFPTAAVRALAGMPAQASLKEVLESAPVQAHFQQVLKELAKTATGSASRVARLHLMHEAPSIDRGEVTDKGSINQRAVLKHRDALANAMHADTLPFTLKP